MIVNSVCDGPDHAAFKDEIITFKLIFLSMLPSRLLVLNHPSTYLKLNHTRYRMNYSLTSANRLPRLGNFLPHP